MGRTKEAKPVISCQEELLITFLLDLAVSANLELNHLDPGFAQSFPKLFRAKASFRLVEDDHLFFRFTDGKLRDAVQASQMKAPASVERVALVTMVQPRLGRRSRAMFFIGCNFHTRFQQIAMLVPTTGELVIPLSDKHLRELVQEWCSLHTAQLAGRQAYARLVNKLQAKLNLALVCRRVLQNCETGLVGR